ncbi:hypothetical protein EJB05_29682 [Eragrostis curvula]|uniref:Uncharacterized protein n=1 Tax=Eragrostis curvula TaxID=38414 RepID=A0A5J9UTN8_9POAL|nr:hypothetical protein EJB05_29682 [Eragrostis curvula]
MHPPMGRNIKKKKTKSKNKTKKQEAASSSNPAVASGPAKVWQPGVDALEEGEELQFDPDAYNYLRGFNIGWPCLSFDIVRDQLGLVRSEFPHTLYGVAGTQAEKAPLNYIGIFKLSNINGKKREPIPASAVDGNSDEDSDNSSDDEAEEINEDTKPIVWDISPFLNSLADSGTRPHNEEDIIHKHLPLKVFSGHKDEGYAIDWSPLVPGRLVSGDCNGYIHLWEPTSSNWNVDANPFVGHSKSVEDLQRSPTQAHIFASCSMDKTIAIWDLRTRKEPCITIKAHNSDVNVISWNRLVTSMIASGCDDGSFSIRDLRLHEKNMDTLIAHFEYHKKAITSIEWSPHEASTLAVTSEDHQLTIWDLALERDAEEEAEFRAKMKEQANAPDDLPPQLLFVHQGQKDLKELHWHPQIPSMIISTGADGFNVLMPSNIDTTIPGDCNSGIHLWEPTSSNWNVDANPLVGHSKSVEDLQASSGRTLNTAQIPLVASHPQVYEPCDDSFALVDALLSDKAQLLTLQPRLCMEIGCGSGYVITSLAIMLRQLGSGTQYIATDINQYAAKTTQATLEAHGVHADVIATDIVSGLEKRLAGMVDVVVVNPPYVPTPEEEIGCKGIASSWAGGLNGRQVIDRILPAVREILSERGWLYMIALEDNDPSDLCHLMKFTNPTDWEQASYVHAVCIFARVGSLSSCVARFGFASADVTVLTDDDARGGSVQMPTGANIKRALADMVARAAPGDVLFWAVVARAAPGDMVARAARMRGGRGHRALRLQPHHRRGLLGCGGPRAARREPDDGVGLVPQRRPHRQREGADRPLRASATTRARFIPYDALVDHLAGASGVDASHHAVDHLLALFGADASAKFHHRHDITPRADDAGILLSGCY